MTPPLGDELDQDSITKSPLLAAAKVETRNQTRYLASSINLYRTAERRTASAFKQSMLEKQGAGALSQSNESNDIAEMSHNLALTQ